MNYKQFTANSDPCIRTDLFSDNVRVLWVISQTVPVAIASRLSVLTVTYSPTVKPDLQRSVNLSQCFCKL